MKTNLTKGDIVTCTLTSLERDGYACVKHQDALLYVWRGVPGDQVRLRVKKLRANFGSAEITEVVSPSRARVDPGCSAFGEGCGGCQWLHIDYSVQLSWKEKILNKALSKALGTEIHCQPTRGMRDPRAFRNKLSLTRDGNGRFGFMKENSKNLIFFDQCPMELPQVQRLYKRLRLVSFPPSVTQLHLRGTRSECGLVMFADGPSPLFEKTAKKLAREIPILKSIAVKTRSDLDGGLQLLAGLPFLSQRVGRLEFRLPPGVFFQTNYFQALSLLEAARQLLKIAPGETVVDLYSGVGFFALDLAAQAGRVIGIEGNRTAVEAARLNARLNRASNAEFRSVAAVAGLRAFKPGEIDALLLDPPRAGCEEAVLTEVLRLRPPRLVYFSCDAEILSRDCARLVDGGYLLGDVVPVDMFPHTYHLETAVKLVRRG